MCNPVPYSPRDSSGIHAFAERGSWIYSLTTFVLSFLFLIVLLRTPSFGHAIGELREQLRDILRWRTDPWRRHGQLIAGLPLTSAEAASDGDLVAVTGRVVGGGAVDGSEAGLTGHLVLDDGSSTHLQLGRAGSGLVTETFLPGELVFAVGTVRRAGSATHPFRDGEHAVALVPGADDLFLVGRGSRELTCLALAEREGRRRRALRPSLLMITAAVCALSGALTLALR
jgi:hypothetical protein